MRLDFSHLEKRPVLDYEAPPPPRTWREWFVDLSREAIEQFGGPTFCMVIGGLLLMAIGMMIGSNDETGMEIFAAGFVLLGILFSAWTMK